MTLSLTNKNIKELSKDIFSCSRIPIVRLANLIGNIVASFPGEIFGLLHLEKVKTTAITVLIRISLYQF